MKQIPENKSKFRLKIANIGFFLIFSVLFIVLSCKTAAPIPEKIERAEKAEKAIIISPAIETQTIIKFYVDPSVFYNDEFGYIGIGYQTKEEVWEKRKRFFANRNLSQADYEKVYNAIPKGGIISVHIGRKDLMHANTRYYVFNCSKNNRSIFRINGREGIPNIKGRDGNWWNIVELPLNEDVENVINVIVTDKRVNKDFNFRIIREEIIVPVQPETPISLAE